MTKSIAKNISMYEEDWEAVDEEARALGATTSAAVRYIIRQWLRLKQAQQKILVEVKQ